MGDLLVTYRHMGGLMGGSVWISTVNLGSKAAQVELNFTNLAHGHSIRAGNMRTLDVIQPGQFQLLILTWQCHCKWLAANFISDKINVASWVTLILRCNESIQRSMNIVSGTARPRDVPIDWRRQVPQVRDGIQNNVWQVYLHKTLVQSSEGLAQSSCERRKRLCADIGRYSEPNL